MTLKLAVFLTDYFPFGGLQRDCLGIAGACAARDHEVTLFTRTWEGERPAGGAFAVEVLGRRGLTNEGRNRNLGRDLRRLLPGRGFDGVVGFNRLAVGMDVYFGSDPCYEAKVRRLKPAWYRLTPRYRHFKRLEERLFARGGRVEFLLLTPHEIPVYEAIYGTERERFHLLPPGIPKREIDPADRVRVRREQGWGEEDRVLLFVGSGFRVKGLERAVRAVASLGSRPGTPTVRLAVVGKGDGAPYGRLAEQLGAGHRVAFLGGRDDVGAFFAAADLLVHPAHSESAGMVLLEGLAAGLPVVTTDTCGYAFHVERSGGGVVLPSPFAQEALDREVGRLLDPAVARPLAEAGRDYGRREDLYSCHARAAEIIEAVVGRCAE